MASLLRVWRAGEPTRVGLGTPGKERNAPFVLPRIGYNWFCKVCDVILNLKRRPRSGRRPLLGPAMGLEDKLMETRTTAYAYRSHVHC